jgi:hypothetical protein
VSDLTAGPVPDKTIQDPIESNAYTPALNTEDPAQRAAALEVFVNRYPNSTVKLNALEQAMAAWVSNVPRCRPTRKGLFDSMTFARKQ